MQARNWTQQDFAVMLNCPEQTIHQIIQGTQEITPETAMELATVLGTSAQFWLNLEANYRLHLAKQERQTDIPNRIEVSH